LLMKNWWKFINLGDFAPNLWCKYGCFYKKNSSLVSDPDS